MNILNFIIFSQFTNYFIVYLRTGVLRFGKFDVTEAQLCIIGIHFVSFFFGPQVWHTQFLGVQLWFLILSFSLTTASVVLIQFAQTIGNGGIGKNGSTVAGTSIISPILPFLLVVIPAFIISEKSKSQIYLNHPVLYLLTFGILAAKVSCRLVVAHMSKSEMNLLDSGLFGPSILFLNQYFNEFFNEYYILWLAFLWCTYDLIGYCSTVCLEMVSYLNIHLFKIPYPPKISKVANVKK